MRQGDLPVCHRIVLMGGNVRVAIPKSQLGKGGIGLSRRRGTMTVGGGRSGLLGRREKNE